MYNPQNKKMADKHGIKKIWTAEKIEKNLHTINSPHRIYNKRLNSEKCFR